jgi:hypothetical protein
MCGGINLSQCLNAKSGQESVDGKPLTSRRALPAPLEPVQNLEFGRLQRPNSTLQAPKEPENRVFCGLLTAKNHNLNRL